MIENKQLAHFLELAKQKNFRDAAKKLRLSQPALTRSIQRLEKLLAVKLFIRSAKQTTLTAYGEALLPRAANMLNSLSDVHQMLDNLKGLEVGEFRVGFGPTYADSIAARSIGRFSTLYPGIAIYTELGRFTELLEFLNAGKIDLYLGETSTLSPVKDYEIVPLKRRTALYYCRSDHPIFNLTTIDYRHISKYPLVSCQLPYRLLPHIKEHGDAFPGDEQTFVYSNIVCDSFSICKNISLYSNAICLIPELLVTSELENGELRILDYKHEQITTQSGIVHLASRDLSPAAVRYIEIVREVDEQL